jgi:hypothetical protein
MPFIFIGPAVGEAAVVVFEVGKGCGRQLCGGASFQLSGRRAFGLDIDCYRGRSGCSAGRSLTAYSMIARPGVLTLYCNVPSLASL